MRAKEPSASRTIRPYPAGSGTLTPNTMAPEAFSSNEEYICSKVAVFKSGVSPLSTITSSKRFKRGNAALTAEPEPVSSVCSTNTSGAVTPHAGSPALTVSSIVAASCPTTSPMAAGFNAWAAFKICAIMGRPQTGCKGLGKGDFIRVPLPAARMRIHRFFLATILFNSCLKRI